MHAWYRITKSNIEAPLQSAAGCCWCSPMQHWLGTWLDD